MTGGRRADNLDQHGKPRTVGQALGLRHPGQRSSLLAKSTAGTAAVIPVTVICAVVPRWLGVLAVLLLALSSLIVGLAAAVIPQESSDRLSWWREWLRHRERMAKSSQDYSEPRNAE